MAAEATDLRLRCPFCRRTATLSSTPSRRDGDTARRTPKTCGPHWTTLEHIGPQDLSFFDCWKHYETLFPSFSTIHKPLLHVKEQVKTYRLDPEEADGRGGPCGGQSRASCCDRSSASSRKKKRSCNVCTLNQVTASHCKLPRCL